MREKLVEAIVTVYRQHSPENKEHVVREALKRITSDLNLAALATDLGIDVHALLVPAKVFDSIFPNGSKLPEVRS